MTSAAISLSNTASATAFAVAGLVRRRERSAREVTEAYFVAVAISNIAPNASLVRAGARLEARWLGLSRRPRDISTPPPGQTAT